MEMVVEIGDWRLEVKIGGEDWRWVLEVEIGDGDGRLEMEIGDGDWRLVMEIGDGHRSGHVLGQETNIKTIEYKQVYACYIC